MAKANQITRRDFLNGTLLALGSALLPSISLGQVLSGNTNVSDTAKKYYPPRLTGMRGSHAGSFEMAHALGWAGNKEWGPVTDIDEEYDLVVVGGGISGLSAARFYQQKYGKDARILILDNHDDFGGHAKRNEFWVNDQLRINYGGTQAFDNPKNYYSDTTMELLADIGVDLDKLKQSYDLDFCKKHGLGQWTFFDKQTYGRSELLPNLLIDADAYYPGVNPSKISINEAIDKMPISIEAKKQFRHLVNINAKNTLDDISVFDRLDYSMNTSYFAYLKEKLGIAHPEVLSILRAFPAFFLARGSDSLAVIEAMGMALPGVDGNAALPLFGESLINQFGAGEPYVYHPPEGLASVARCLVRKLIPQVAKGNTMEDVILAEFDYQQLDKQDSPVKIRLNSTVVNVEHQGTAEQANHVNVTYVKQGKAYRVKAKNTILACYNMMIPHLMPELPSQQKQALSELVKAPLVYTSVCLKNWQAFKDLGIAAVYSPGRMHSTMILEYPVNYGGYSTPQSTDQPMVVTMMHVPMPKDYGLPIKEQYRQGRQQLYSTPFSTFETEIKEHLTEMLGSAGFDAERDIEAITVNRWSHGYAFAGSALEYPDFEENGPHIIGRKPYGRVAVANSDSGGQPYVHSAIDQAWRAVNELKR